MQQHVQLGSNKVESMIEDYNLGALTGITILRNLVAGHHEMMDGSGYPKGRSSGPIPLEARIVTVADIFDALTSERVYKKEWGFETGWHLERMSHFSRLIARGLSVSHNLSDDFIEQLFLFAPLHDI